MSTIKLKKLIASIPYETAEDIGSINIKQICYDSRKVTAGSLFVCMPGHAFDGHSFAADAVKKGAAALIVERHLNVDCPQVIVSDARAALAPISTTFFKNPAEDLVLAGVTGTNGKTTVTHILKSITEVRGKSALVGTVGVLTTGSGTYETTVNTSPESYEFQRMLNDFNRRKIKYVSAEVSSIGLAEHRLDYCRFDAAIFTNLTRDHLDYHETMDNYYQSKTKLFNKLKESGVAVVNLDDQYGRRLSAGLNRCITFGLTPDADVVGTILEQSLNYTLFELEITGSRALVRLPLLCQYNVSNALAASAAAWGLGFSLEEIVRGLEAMPQIPGRMQMADFGQAYKIFIDYAHTPDGLEKVLLGLKSFPHNKLITVFGSIGDGDRGKRPEMARVAETYSDYAVVTSTQPKGEDPDLIIQDIVQGFSGTSYTQFLDRTDAINYALDIAGLDDIVVLTGLGHRTKQVFKDRVLEYSDYDRISSYFANLGMTEIATTAEQ